MSVVQCDMLNINMLKCDWGLLYSSIVHLHNIIYRRQLEQGY